MKKTVLFFLVVTLLVGFPHAQEAIPSPEISGGDELVKEKGAFRETWIRPDADITQYSKLYLWQAVYQFRDVGEPKSSGTTASLLRDTEGPFGVRDESKEMFQRLVSDAFVKELERSKIFEVVEEVGPDTLIVRAAVLDIVSNVPPSFTGTADVYLSAVGEASFVFELIDAETGVIQARSGERRRIQPPSRDFEVSVVPTNAATVWNEVERWARDVARDLRKALEKGHKKAEK
jgi:hypothetical protein